MPKFIGLLPVRDEEDIIEQCLLHALTWANAVFVYDTGSVDTTYSKVLNLARSDSRIVPLGTDPVYYNENRVRGHLFHAARQRLRNGDWFLRIDADEFHHIPPPIFVRDYLSPGDGVVYHQYYDFQLTSDEAYALASPAAVRAERAKPIELRRRHYTVSVYSEPRMCRYRSSMRWPASVSFPYNAGYVSKMRLPIRHYPHRDPLQLKRRYILRSIMMADDHNRSHWTEPEKHHWSDRNWMSFVVEPSSSNLHHWQDGEDLPLVLQHNHLPNLTKWLAKRLLYSSSLPRLLDLSRPQWSQLDYPLPISEATQALLAAELCL
jgi:hypothetical protein